MKKTLFALVIPILFYGCHCPATTSNLNGTDADRDGLRKTTTAIVNAFALGDVNAILALHHPEVVKYFGGKSVIHGREELRKQLTSWLASNKVVFLENTVESTVFNGETAIETSIFSIRSAPKNGDSASVVRGRSMVVYIKYPQSPTGWASLREIVQEAPPN